MRKTLLLFQLDFRKGLRSCKHKMIGIMIAVITLSLLSTSMRMASSGPSIDTLTLGDSFTFLLCGISIYSPDAQRSEPFVMPDAWLMVMLLGVFLTLEYPQEDIECSGETSILLGGSRTSWWLSKCLWVLTMTTLFAIEVVIGLSVSTLLLGGTLSPEVSGAALQRALFFVNAIQGPWNVSLMMLTYFVALCSLSLIQLALSLVIKPIPSFGVTGLILLASAYFSNPLLPGEYLMSARSSLFVSRGFSPEFGIALNLALAIWAVVFSLIYFKQSDLMPRDDT